MEMENERALPRVAAANIGSASHTLFPAYDPAEVAADRIIHVLGVCFAIVGAVAVVVLAALNAGALEIVATSLYAASLLAVMGFSAAYNLSKPSQTREILRRFDHATIFFLIAGTYSAITLGRVDAHWAQWLAVVAWSIALIGATIKIIYPRRFERLAVFAYVAMGIIVFLSLAPLAGSLSTAVVILVGVGSVLYVSGVVFHLWDGLRFQNAIWHGLVLCAAGCHYAAVVLNM